MEPPRQLGRALDRVRRVALTGDRQQLQAAMEQLRQAIVTLGTTRRPGEAVAAAWAEPFATAVYPRLWAAHLAVGQPCGPDEAGLLRWLHEQAAIAAETERRQQERRWQRGLAALRQLILATKTTGVDESQIKTPSTDGVPEATLPRVTGQEPTRLQIP